MSNQKHGLFQNVTQILKNVHNSPFWIVFLKRYSIIQKAKSYQLTVNWFICILPLNKKANFINLICMLLCSEYHLVCDTEPSDYISIVLSLTMCTLHSAQCTCHPLDTAPRVPCLPHSSAWECVMPRHNKCHRVIIHTSICQRRKLNCSWQTVPFST